MSTEQMIDNAIRDWETSPDAMRWTPDAPQVNPVPDVRVSMPAGVLFRLDVDSFVRALGDARRGIEQFAAGLGETFKALDEARRTVARPVRVSAMRRSYRAKRGGRW